VNRSAVRYWLTLLVVVAGIYGSWAFWRAARSGPGTVPPAAPGLASPSRNAGPPAAPAAPTGPRFRLTDQRGRPFDAQALRGRVWVANFIFTNCQARCRLTTQQLALLQQDDAFREALLVSFTCDPDTDTPQVLDEYARRFGADPKRWSFLTGDFAQIQRLGVDFFRVGVERGGHSDRCFVVDRQGQVRENFYVTEPGQLDRLQKHLAQVLAEPRRDG
jgi:protein SCO1/2